MFLLLPFSCGGNLAKCQRIEMCYIGLYILIFDMLQNVICCLRELAALSHLNREVKGERDGNGDTVDQWRRQGGARGAMGPPFEARPPFGPPFEFHNMKQNAVYV